MLKMRKCIVILITMLFIVVFSRSVFAVNNENGEYSELYKRYLNMSEEEKKNLSVIPRKYDIPMSVLYDENESTNNGWFSNVLTAIKLSQKKQLPKSFILLKDENTDVECEIYGGIDIKVENQNPYGLCWGFASLTALETNLALQGKDYDFSEMHLEYLTSEQFGGNRVLDTGGNFSVFEKYVSYKYGPVLEENVSYREYSEEEYDYLIEQKPVIYVNETIDFPTINKLAGNLTEEDLALFRQKVKEHIMNYGGLYSDIYADAIKEYNGKYVLNSSRYETNHAITIIGWDDEFSIENFPEDCRPKENGAYIALNSWGEDWGEKGIFYISYEDLNVEESMSGVVKSIQENNNYDNCEGIKFQDENLYKEIKRILNKNIISCNDQSREIYLSKISLKNIYSLDLSNNNISNIDGLENFINLRNLDLSDNNIIGIANLEKLININVLDLSNNNIRNFSNLPENAYSILNLSGNTIEVLPSNKIDVSELYLDGCDLNSSILVELYDKLLPEFSFLSLKKNNIRDFSCLKYYDSKGGTIDISENDIDLSKIPNIGSLILKNCNISDISEIPTNFNIYAIDLSYNPIKNIDALSELNLVKLDISYTDVKDVSKFITLNRLNISGNLEVTGLDKLVNLQELEMNNCNLDVNDMYSIIENHENLEYLSINDNNIENLNFLENCINLNSLYANNNHIMDISGLSNLNSIYQLGLSNNDITDISSLSKFEALTKLNLSSNRINDISSLTNYRGFLELDLRDNMNLFIPLEFQKINIYKILFNNSYTLEINIEKGKENIIELPIAFNEALKKGRYDENVIFNCENCFINSRATKLNLKSDTLGKGQAKISIEGGSFAGTEYIINYNTIDNINVTGMKIKKEANKKYYVENEKFDSDGLIVEVIYENGLKEETNDYALINSENLKSDQENIIIRSNKNPEIEIMQFIKVYGKDEVREIKFEDDIVYNAIKDKTAFDEQDVVIVEYDDEQNTIVIPMKDIEAVTEINISHKDVKNIGGLENFCNLISLYLRGSRVDSIREILELKKIEHIELYRIDNYLIDSSVAEIILPQYIYESLTIIEDVKAKGYAQYCVNDGSLFQNQVEIIIDSKRKVALVKIDRDMMTEKNLRLKQINVEILGGKIDDLTYRVNCQNLIDYTEEQDGDIKYLININPNTTVEKTLEKIQVSDGITKEVYNGDSKVKDTNANLATGMIIKILVDGTTYEYVAVVIGDCNGSGTTNVADLTKLMQSRAESLGTNRDEAKVLKGAFEKAVDLNKDGKISASDITKLSMFIAENK